MRQFFLVYVVSEGKRNPILVSDGLHLSNHIARLGKCFDDGKVGYVETDYSVMEAWLSRDFLPEIPGEPSC